jgi:hypothetical protein
VKQAFQIAAGIIIALSVIGTTKFIFTMFMMKQAAEIIKVENEKLMEQFKREDMQRQAIAAKRKREFEEKQKIALAIKKAEEKQKRSREAALHKIQMAKFEKEREIKELTVRFNLQYKEPEKCKYAEGTLFFQCVNEKLRAKKEFLENHHL